MNDRCPNCGQPTLASDVTCWHCGQPLPGRAAVAPQGARAVERPETSLALSDLAVYAVLTSLVLMAALLAAAALGRQPIVPPPPGAALPSGWLQKEGDGFALAHPPDWLPLEEEGLDRWVAAREPLPEGWRWLAEQAGDLEAAVVLLNDGPEGPFVLLGRSIRLRQRSYEAILADLPQAIANVPEVTIGQTAATRFLAFDSASLQGWPCWLRVVHGQRTAFVLAACAPGGDGPAAREQKAILDAFGSRQPISSQE